MGAEKKQIRKFSKMKDSLYPVSAILGLILLWYSGVHLFSIPDYVLPDPLVTLQEFFNYLGLLSTHTLVTAYETLAGLILAIVFGIIVSIAIVWSRGVERTVLPLLVFFQTTPKIAIAPLFVVWFGFGYTPKVIISFWLAYFPIVIATVTGLRAVETEMIDLTESMSATTLQTFVKVRIPNALPHFFSGLKLGGLVALLGSLVGEFVGSDAGLGYLIVMANHNTNVKLLFSVLIVLVILGKVLYSLISWIERYCIAWHVVMRSEEEKFFTA